MTDVTAKIKCVANDPHFGGQCNLLFEPDYSDDRNKAWADATPTLQLHMIVKGSVAEHFRPGNAYTLTFTPDGD